MKPGGNKKTRFIAFIIALAIGASAVIGVAYFLNTKYYPPILMYHHVEDAPLGGSMYVNPKQFEEQMKFLRDNKYKVISLDELSDMIKGGAKIPHNIVVLTFDDGNVNNYLYAFPALKKYKIPATVFVISDYIDKGGYLKSI